MLLALLLTSAHAAPPTQAEAHALVAGSALTFFDAGETEPLIGGVVLDYARLQGVLRHETGDGQRLGVQVQLEALNDPALLDALAVLGPTDTVTLEVGLQRTWLSEMFDVLVPIQVLRDRTSPESVAPARRMGAQVVLGPRTGAGTRAHVGVWAPDGAMSGRFTAGILSALVEHQTDADLVLHGAVWATPEAADAPDLAPAWEQGFDVAVGYEPDGTRIVAEVAGRRSREDVRVLGATVYASHRLDPRRLEPAGFLDFERFPTASGLDGNAVGARAGLTVHLVEDHAQWTSDLGARTTFAEGETRAVQATAGTRLMVGF